MESSINYKETLFELSKLNPIRGKPTFKMLHNLQNKIKSNTKSVYSIIGGGVHGHIGLVLTDAQYALISPTTFVYPTRPGTIIVPDSTASNENSNMQIFAHRGSASVSRSDISGVWFKHFFQTAHWELRETPYFNIEDADMHHANMVRDEDKGLKEFLNQEKYQSNNPTITP